MRGLRTLQLLRAFLTLRNRDLVLVFQLFAKAIIQGTPRSPSLKTFLFSVDIECQQSQTDTRKTDFVSDNKCQ